MKHERAHFVYLVDSRLGLVRLGVAAVPRQRLRELQVGSPVRLRLVLTSPFPSREEARAVAAELARRFAARLAHGHWYRVTRAEVERALASRPLRAAPARAAPARAAEGERSGAPGRGRGARPRTEKERAYQRRRRRARAATQKRAARLLARGTSRVAVAAALGVTTRTLRNWSGSPDFARLLERERERLQRPRPGSARTRSSRRPAPAAAGEQGREREPTAPAPAGEDEASAAIEARRFDSYERWLDSNDARRGKLTPAERRARRRR
jgi:hypothetical protein